MLNYWLFLSRSTSLTELVPQGARQVHADSFYIRLLNWSTALSGHLYLCWNLYRLIKDERYHFHWESRLKKYSLKPLESQNQFVHFLWVGYVCFHMTLSRKLANVSNSSPEALENRPLSLWISTAPLSYTKTCRYEHKELQPKQSSGSIIRRAKVKSREIIFFVCIVLIFFICFWDGRGQ